MNERRFFGRFGDKVVKVRVIEVIDSGYRVFVDDGIIIGVLYLNYIEIYIMVSYEVR